MKRKQNPNFLELTCQYRIYPNKEIKKLLNWTSNELLKLYNHFLKQYRKEDKIISKLPLKEQKKERNKLLDKQQKELINWP
ncbi:hypothetical protein [endosymbiont GvMRE of Glomus versiforme]|uniref:hypothetical protein n=1 Tax=endosymbiont GvMRE of Glomus versiforme TaxID=2039283 RepID=UPI0011C3B4F9|nr:hypothetical protein [endosymbiont GvMRE of Glomus versiforme]